MLFFAKFLLSFCLILFPIKAQIETPFVYQSAWINFNITNISHRTIQVRFFNLKM